MKYVTLKVDPDEIDRLIADELRDLYVSVMTEPLNEPDRGDFSDALLKVIQYHMSPASFESWYENIKEL